MFIWRNKGFMKKSVLLTAVLCALCFSFISYGAMGEGSTGTKANAQTVSTQAVPAAQEVSAGAVYLDRSWRYADFSVINEGHAVLYRAQSGRKGKTVAVNAGHGTKGGASKKTYSHPDKTGKVTGGTNANGAVMSACVSSGMTFNDGTPEAEVTLREAVILKDMLLNAGYDVLMIRDGSDVQLDNVARTVIANNRADIHIAIHWDGDGLSSIKGAFYMSVPDALKNMEPVKSMWEKHERLGDCLIRGLETEVSGIKIWNSSGHGCLDQDLTQTSYSTIPSVDIELGNQCSSHSDSILKQEAAGLLCGVNLFFGF